MTRPSFSIEKNWKDTAANVLLITSLQQKQSPEVFYEKRFSQKFLKIHSVGVNKVAGLRPEPY